MYKRMKYISTLLRCKQVYHVFGDNFSAAVECLLSKMSLAEIVGYFSGQPVQKVTVDEDDLWQYLVVQYKATNLDVSMQIRVCMSNQPAIDTGV